METALQKQQRLEKKRAGNRKILKGFMSAWISVTTVVMVVFATMAFATSDVTQPLTRLNTLIFAILTVIGIGLIAFGVLQLGLAFRSQDPQQRSNGLLSIAGGVIVLVAERVANYVAQGS